MRTAALILAGVAGGVLLTMAWLVWYFTRGGGPYR